MLTLMLVVVNWVNIALVIVTAAIIAAFARSFLYLPSNVLDTQFPTQLHHIFKVIAFFSHILSVRHTDILDKEAHLACCLQCLDPWQSTKDCEGQHRKFLVLSIASSILVAMNTIGIIGKWIVGRNIICIRKTNNSSKNATQVLAFVVYSSFANCDVRVAVLAKLNLSRVVHRLCCGRSVEQDHFGSRIDRFGGGIVDPPGQND